MTESGDLPTHEPTAPWRSIVESQIKNMQPEQLVSLWKSEKPWEATEQVKSLFGFKKIQRPLLYIDREAEYPLGSDNVVAYKDKNVGIDVRGWILEKLGVQDIQAKQIDRYQSLDLIAQGLKIPRFHAALFEMFVLSASREDIAQMFEKVMLHPQDVIKEDLASRFINPEKNKMLQMAPNILFQLAETVENITAKEWKDISEIADTAARDPVERLPEDDTDAVKNYDRILQIYGETGNSPLGHNLRITRTYAVLTDVTRMAIADKFKLPEANPSAFSQPVSSHGTEMPLIGGTAILFGQWGSEKENFPPPFNTWSPIAPMSPESLN